MRTRVPGPFVSLLAQERETPSCHAIVSILMPGDHGSEALAERGRRSITEPATNARGWDRRLPP
jgi:hypothetical protein